MALRVGSIFRAIDNFSASRPSYLSPAQNAVTAWNTAPGAQFYSFTPTSNDVWIYINLSTTGNYGLTAGIEGITWLCYRYYVRGLPQVACEDSGNQAVNIYYASIYLNTDADDGDSQQRLQEVIGHESGHGMGLAHNKTDSSSLMWPSANSTGAPAAPDWGHYPGCSNSGFGTYCIYGVGD